MAKSINIRPTTSVYATYKHIKYDPWTAIAEFVDNSTQSFYDNESQLQNTKYWKGLNVDIIYEKNEIDGDSLIIRDNAYGMDFNDFQRAIVLDSPPKKKTRSEFGMGLKTAACWFGVVWSVESTALGSPIKYKATIDVDLLHKYRNEEITVEEIPCHPRDHGTVIKIKNLNRRMSGRQIGKTKDQLRGMYRSDLRSGRIRIYYRGESLSYQTPEALIEELPDGTQKEWKKEIQFSLSCNQEEYSVSGFIGLLNEGSTSGAGFTLMRHGRVIVGGYENAYRPEEIFEKSNSFIYQRLFGELNLDDWPVTQTKDAFDWYNGLEEAFIEKLLEECEEYRKKAKEYRKGNRNRDFSDIESVVKSISDAGIIDDVEILQLHPKHVEAEESDENSDNNDDYSADQAIPEYSEKQDNGRIISFTAGSHRYSFQFILRNSDPELHWLSISQDQENDVYLVEWNTRHPFFEPYIEETDFLEIMAKFTFSIALSEIEARHTGVDGKIEPSVIRMKMNETLKRVMKEGVRYVN